MKQTLQQMYETSRVLLRRTLFINSNVHNVQRCKCLLDPIWAILYFQIQMISVIPKDGEIIKHTKMKYRETFAATTKDLTRVVLKIK